MYYHKLAFIVDVKGVLCSSKVLRITIKCIYRTVSTSLHMGETFHVYVAYHFCRFHYTCFLATNPSLNQRDAYQIELY